LKPYAITCPESKWHVVGSKVQADKMENNLLLHDPCPEKWSMHEILPTTVSMHLFPLLQGDAGRKLSN
jgi:hypothetical protein